MGRRDNKNQFLYIIFFLLLFTAARPTVEAVCFPIDPPGNPVKLIFIHHSCGENWLSDGDGGLGRALGMNNYFVSDTNYGWGPSNIGDRTDILDWVEWFSGPATGKYMKALLHENNKHSSYTRNLPDPGGDNSIIMFKSCFPNSQIEGNSQDPPETGQGLTIANAKAIYVKILSFFAKHPETLFIAITAPPVQDRRLAENARAFNNWLVYEWLKNYKGFNVGVYDFYNTLTGFDNHHRINKNRVEHVYETGKNTLYYALPGDDHPGTTGNKKAEKEFIPLLNMFYNNWKQKVHYTPPHKIVLPGAGKAEQSEKKVFTAKFDGKAPVCELALRKGIPPRINPVSNIADFEEGCSKWAVFSDSDQNTQIEFRCEKKKCNKQDHVLKIAYSVSTGEWGTCSLVYPEPLNYTGKRGISFNLMAEDADEKFQFIVYQGKSPDALNHFEITIHTVLSLIHI